MNKQELNVIVQKLIEIYLNQLNVRTSKSCESPLKDALGMISGHKSDGNISITTKEDNM